MKLLHHTFQSVTLGTECLRVIQQTQGLGVPIDAPFKMIVTRLNQKVITGLCLTEAINALPAKMALNLAFIIRKRLYHYTRYGRKIREKEAYTHAHAWNSTACFR